MRPVRPLGTGLRQEAAIAAAIRAADIAAQQWGVIGAMQLRDCRVSESTAGRWRANGRLHRLHPGVHSLGHASVPVQGQLVAALLHAGPGSGLSHATAAWWRGLIEHQPAQIHVSTRSAARSTGGVIVHHPRQLTIASERRLPVTTVARTLLDLASTAPLDVVRYALANADYRGLLDPEDVTAIRKQGRPRSAKIREALRIHEPRLAHSRSRLERAFIALCERYEIPVPEINAHESGYTVDALWRRERLAVELDGYGNHHSRAQIERDRRRDLRLRAAGFVVVRYSEEQILNEPELVAADIRRLLSSPDSPA